LLAPLEHLAALTLLLLLLLELGYAQPFEQLAWCSVWVWCQLARLQATQLELLLLLLLLVLLRIMLVLLLLGLMQRLLLLLTLIVMHHQLT
jgi:hypothetical protein